MPERGQIVCHKCSASTEVTLTRTGLARVPTGWKRHQDKIFRKNCWKSSDNLYTVTVPVAFALDGRSSKELWDALADLWAKARAATNLTFSELAKSDIVRRPDMEVSIPSSSGRALRRAYDRIRPIQKRSLGFNPLFVGAGLAAS